MRGLRGKGTRTRALLLLLRDPNPWPESAPALDSQGRPGVSEPHDIAIAWPPMSREAETPKETPPALGALNAAPSLAEPSFYSQRVTAIANVSARSSSPCPPAGRRVPRGAGRCGAHCSASAVRRPQNKLRKGRGSRRSGAAAHSSGTRVAGTPRDEHDPLPNGPANKPVYKLFILTA